MSCWSVTAVRTLPECKTRLAECLSSQRRIELVATMLGHVGPAAIVQVDERTPILSSGE